MRIIYLTPGSGDNFYCENCLRDHTLVGALRELGHDALICPLYLPVSLAEPDPPPTTQLFMGGMNVYLQQKSALFRHTPRWLDRVFDAPRMLKWLARQGTATDPADLAELTMSMLRGEQGRQRKELERLTSWLADQARPEIICLSNALLMGMARRIKQRVDRPIVCMLQDEDEFLDQLPDPQRGQSWQLLAERAADVDGFIAVSSYYADFMQQRLGFPPDKLRVVRPGLKLPPALPEEGSTGPLVIGYLSRICEDKGLDILVEAFIRLKRQQPFRQLSLRVAGGKSPADEPFFRRVFERLQQAGVSDDVDFVADFHHDAREEFFRSISLLCVPERRPPAYARYVLESLSWAVPVVVPDIGVFSELSSVTDAVLLCPADGKGDSLFSVLESALSDRNRLRELGLMGRQKIGSHFDLRRSAQELIQLFVQEIAQANKPE